MGAQIMHAAMLAGCAASTTEWCAQTAALIHRAYSNPTDLPSFFHEHFLSDWGLLRALLNRTVDDIALVLHLILLGASGSCHAEDVPTWPDNLARPADGSADFSQLRTNQARTVLENVLSRVHISRYTDAHNLNELLGAAATRLTEGEEDVGGVFTAEVLETFDVSTLSTQVRKDKMPALWRFHR